MYRKMAAAENDDRCRKTRGDTLGMAPGYLLNIIGNCAWEEKVPEDDVRNVYDNIVKELFRKKEPLTALMDGIRKIARLAGVAGLCLWTMAAGDGDMEVSASEKHMYAKGFLENLLSGNILNMGNKEDDDDGHDTLSIEVIDEFPPESEMELCILEERRKAMEEDDGIFVGMTSLVDTGSDLVFLRQEDGSIREDDGTGIYINTAQFFVPDGGSRCFGVPNFSTELFAEGEWETRQEFEDIDLIGDDCEEFNHGIDVTRLLVNSGFLNEEIAKLLGRFPQIEPYEREYTLRLVNAGTTLRQEDQTSWWDVDYALYTKADNGEEIMLVYIDITRVTLAQGEVWDWDDAHYRIDVAVENLWRLMEDPVEDQGEVWIQQIRGDSLADEESVRRFVEEQGAALLVPRGADTAVDWECHRQEEYYYDYLVWQGETADYEVTLAIPLMEKQDEGYYLASCIHKEAEDKTACHHVLSSMMQTFRGVPYLHVVKEGEMLSKIAEKYTGTQSVYPQMRLYNEADKDTQRFVNPDLIYPGQKVTVPELMDYDARECRP